MILDLSDEETTALLRLLSTTIDDDRCPLSPRVQTLKSEPGPPMTLGSVAGAGVRLIIWCQDCSHQVEPDPEEMAARYGAEMTVIHWRERLVCSRCGSRQIDMVVSGTKRRRE
jgi:hypothetical protein